MSYRRPALASLRPYQPEPTGAAIDLSDNTNLFGAPPAATAALTAAAMDLRRYPPAYSPRLQEAIAAYVGVPPECVVTGCGSDDVIDSTFRAFLEPGDRLAASDPTFSMVPVFATVQGAQVVPVPLGEDYDVDTEQLLAADPRLVYVCSPNNPTGTTASAAALQRLLSSRSRLILLDEAYAEFADDGFAARAPEYPNLIVTRTLSKAFGLAGLRVGYAVARPELVAEIAKARGPYKVHTLAERAAIAAVTEDVAWMRAQALAAREVRERFVTALHALGFRPLPSQANFVLVPVADPRGVAQALSERGVRVRAFDALTGIGGALRITCAPWATLEQTLEGLKAVTR